MCAFYIPWIYYKGCNFLSMCVINWIQSMGGSMPTIIIFLQNQKTKKNYKKSKVAKKEE